MVGSCFYYQTPPNNDHPFVVLAPSQEQVGWFICVNITTKRETSDITCELLQGEHPSLTSPVSVVVYASARELPPPLISRLIKNQQLPPFSAALLLRIQQAALGPDSRLKKKFQQAIQKYLQP